MLINMYLELYGLSFSKTILKLCFMMTIGYFFNRKFTQ